MWKKILKQLGKALLVWGLNLVFENIDKNKDGKLSKKELKEFKDLVLNKIKQYK